MATKKPAARKTKTSKPSKPVAKKASMAKRPDKKSRRIAPPSKPAERGLPSAESRAFGAMLASERWYETAAGVIVKAFYKSKGNATHAAKALNISWRSLRDWCQEYPELQRALDSARADVG